MVGRRPAAGYAPGPAVPGDRQVAFLVRAVHSHPRAGEHAEQLPCRMPVRVVRADGDQRDPGAARGQEGRIGVGTAVVRHLEHVRPQVHAGRQETCLGGSAQVAGEQDPDTARGHPHDEREVVGLRGGDRPLWHRRQHLDGHRPHRAPVPRHEHGSARTGPGDQRVHRGSPVVVRRERAGGHHADRPSVECSGEAADVVGVEMGEQNQRQRVDAEPVQAAVHRTDRRAGVDQHALPSTGRQHQRVALTDVAGDDHGVRRRPATHHLANGPADQHDPHHEGQAEGPPSRKPPEQTSGDQQQRCERHRSGRAARPSHRRIRCPGGPVGHQHQPADGPTG